MATVSVKTTAYELVKTSLANVSATVTVKTSANASVKTSAYELAKTSLAKTSLAKTSLANAWAMTSVKSWQYFD